MGLVPAAGREEVNWPNGPREAGLGRDPSAPLPAKCRPRNHVPLRHSAGPAAVQGPGPDHTARRLPVDLFRQQEGLAGHGLCVNFRGCVLCAFIGQIQIYLLV